MTNDETLALIQLARNVEWQYSLDAFTNESLKLLLSAVKRAEKEVLTSINNYAATLPDWAEERALLLLDHFSDLTVGIHSALSGNVLQLASQAGASAFLVHNNILSFDNKILNFNPISLTAEQISGILQNIPVGGYLLNDWVATIYGNVAENIRENILTGMLKGDDYPSFVNRLTEEFGMVRNEATTLARTYVQTVNVGAQEAVYNQNKDLVTGVKWTAVLENSYKGKGHGTCLLCALRDGTVFKLEEAPQLPAHLNCRCIWLPELISWRELGIDMDEIPDAYRPYTIRPDEPINEGGKRTILEHGFYDKSWKEWMSTQNETFQRNALGPNRYGLWKSGKISLADMINTDTGKLRTLAELK